MLALTSLALATSCGLFQPAVAPQVSSVEVVQAGARVQAGNPGVTPGAASVQVQFNVSMNQPTVERSINMYPGSYDPATNPASIQKLQLTSMCDGQWRVRNPNAQPVSFQWDVYGKTEKGVGVAVPSGDTFFNSTKGGNTLRVFVGSALQNTKATNPAACTNTLNSFAWTDSRTVQVTPSVALQAGKAYTLAVSTAAKNEAGTQELPVPYSSGFSVGQGGGRESGVLVPGGSFVNSDGVRIESPIGSIDRNVNVWIERVNPTSIVSLPSEFTLIGGMYRVGATERIVSKRKAFEVILPLPINLPPGNIKIALLSLVNDASIYSDATPTYKLIWTSSYDKIDLSQHLASITQDALDPNGDVFALAFLPQSNISAQSRAARTMGTPSLNIICDTALGLTTDCQCPVGQSCNQTTLNTITDVRAVTNTSYEDFEQIFAASPKLDSIRFAPLAIPECRGAIAAYSAVSRRIFVCLTDTGTLSQGSIPETLRHETFHALQAAFIDLSNNDLRPVRRWIIEATAAASEKSTSSIMNITTFRATAVIYRSVLDNTLETDAYRFQDFWVFTGRTINQGLGYLKPVLQTGLTNPVADVSASLPYSGGFQKAYVDWARNQGAEKTLMFRTDMGLQCTTSSTLSGTEELTFNLEMQPVFQQSRDFERLSSRTIRLTFVNQNPQNIRLRLSANNPSAAFKVYRAKSTNLDKLSNCPDNAGLTDQVQAGQAVSVSSTDALVVFVSNAAAVTSNVQLQVERTGTLDIDDGTPDGNQLVVIGNSSVTDANADGVADNTLPTDALRLLSTDFAGEDADANNRIGDGRVDMSDFRRLRDWLLRSEGLGSFVGSANQPKLSLTVGSSALKYGDFNNSGRLGFNERKAVAGLEDGGFIVSGYNISLGTANLVGGRTTLNSSSNIVVQPVAVTRDAQGLPLLSDFEVFYNSLVKTPSTWVDTNYSLSQAAQLLGSGDLEVWARDLFDYQDVATVRSAIDVNNAPVVPDRVYTRSSPRQTYSLLAGTYTLRLAGVDAQGNVVVGLKKPFTVAAGQDLLFAPATALNVTVQSVYNSAQDDCARMGGVYNFDVKGLFDGAVPDINTSDSGMFVDQNFTGVRQQRKVVNWPLQLESGTIRHCNIPIGRRFVGWDLNYGFFDPVSVTGFYVRDAKPVTVQDNRWPGLVWNSTDLDNPQSPNVSVVLKVTTTSSFPGEAQQIAALMQPGTGTRLLMKPELEANYTLTALDDDTNPGTFFSKTVSGVYIPYGTDAKVTYRGRSEWHHQIFCDIPSACINGSALRVQSQGSPGSAAQSLTAPVVPITPAPPRPKF